MEISLHKKEELLNFVFKDKDNQYIATLNIYGKNFSYVKNENQIIIRFDLKKSIDINDFEIFFKELKSIKLDNEHIIKKIANLKQNNKNFNYLLELYLSSSVYQNYKLNFSLEKTGLYLNTQFVEGAS